MRIERCPPRHLHCCGKTISDTAPSGPCGRARWQPTNGDFPRETPAVWVPALSAAPPAPNGRADLRWPTGSAEQSAADRDVKDPGKLVRIDTVGAHHGSDDGVVQHVTE